MYRDNKFKLSYNEIKKALSNAEELYNRYRSPEAISKVVKVDGDKITVLFEGHFCKSCGVNDWIEDFKYILSDIGIEAEIIDIIEPSDVDAFWRIGVFKLKNIIYNKR
uniref:NifU family protein n=1 Tax=Ignisphaera aggregans TaxID=334771 RepID=A0A7C5USB7_9CREN